MKLSEYIARLQSILEAEGDLPVIRTSPKGGGMFARLWVRHCHAANRLSRWRLLRCKTHHDRRRAQR